MGNEELMSIWHTVCDVSEAHEEFNVHHHHDRTYAWSPSEILEKRGWTGSGKREIRGVPGLCHFRIAGRRSRQGGEDGIGLYREDWEW